MTFTVRRPAERSGADEGDACLTSAGAYRGSMIGVMLDVIRGGLDSESDDGRCWWTGRMTAGNGAGVGAGDNVIEGGKEDNREGEGFNWGIRARALLLVMSGTVQEGSRDRLILATE
jgi:hypothetical protein